MSTATCRLVAMDILARSGDLLLIATPTPGLARLFDMGVDVLYPEESVGALLAKGGPWGYPGTLPRDLTRRVLGAMRAQRPAPASSVA